jgi:hypothetical protein
MKTGIVIAAAVLSTLAVLGAAKKFAPGIHAMVA